MKEKTDSFCKEFPSFYLICGVLASLTHATFDPGSTVPALGDSGAIAGVLGSYSLLASC